MQRIEIHTIVGVSKSKAWDYYTQPKHITHWNFATDEWCCPHAENDLRIGGTYKARMEAKDGSFGFDFEAVYSQLNVMESFSYGMGGRVIDVFFESLADNSTKVRVIFDPETENPIEMQQQGWQAILNNYKEYCETKLTDNKQV